MFDESVGTAVEAHELSGHRRDHLCLGQVFAGQRDIGQRAVALKEPFAGRVERGAEILEVIALVGTPLEERPGRAGGGDQQVFCFVGAGDAVARHLPRVIDHRRHVA